MTSDVRYLPNLPDEESFGNEDSYFLDLMMPDGYILIIHRVDIQDFTVAPDGSLAVYLYQHQGDCILGTSCERNMIILRAMHTMITEREEYLADPNRLLSPWELAADEDWDEYHTRWKAWFAQEKRA